MATTANKNSKTKTPANSAMKGNPARKVSPNGNSTSAKTREKNSFMPQKHHEDAAKHHDEAAKHHRAAAEHYGKGNDQQGADHTQAANGHASKAREESENASKKHADKHQSKK